MAVLETLSQVDWVEQDRRNLEALRAPRVGDRWAERLMIFTCEVLAVGRHAVRIRTRDGERKMSRASFSRWLCYDSVPDKTWADLLPISRKEGPA